MLAWVHLVTSSRALLHLQNYMWQSSILLNHYTLINSFFKGKCFHLWKSVNDAMFWEHRASYQCPLWSFWFDTLRSLVCSVLPFLSLGFCWWVLFLAQEWITWSNKLLVKRLWVLSPCVSFSVTDLDFKEEAYLHPQGFTMIFICLLVRRTSWKHLSFTVTKTFVVFQHLKSHLGAAFSVWEDSFNSWAFVSISVILG